MPQLDITTLFSQASWALSLFFLTFGIFVRQIASVTKLFKFREAFVFSAVTQAFYSGSNCCFFFVKALNSIQTLLCLIQKFILSSLNIYYQQFLGSTYLHFFHTLNHKLLRMYFYKQVL